MKLDDKKRRLIVIGIALLMIISGLIQGIFKLKIDPRITNEVSFILMMAAAFFLFSGRKFGKDKEPEKPAAEIETAEPEKVEPEKKD